MREIRVQVNPYLPPNTVIVSENLRGYIEQLDAALKANAIDIEFEVQK